MENVKNILFVSLSFEWSTCERTLLRDIKIARNNQVNTFCLCSRDSFIDVELKKMGVVPFYNSSKIRTGLLFWRSLPNLIDYVEKYNIQLVHCYDLSVLHAICFRLKNFLKIPIVFTHTKEIDKSFRLPWLRPLKSRIDQVIIQSEEHVENIWDKIGVPPRKIEVCGPGLQSLNKVTYEDKIKFTQKFKTTKTTFLLGAYLNPNLKSLTELNTLLYCLQAIKTDTKFNSKVKLVLFSALALDEFLLYAELTRFVKDHGLENNIYFEDSYSVDIAPELVDVWVGYSGSELLEDYLLLALLAKKPVIMPRTSASKEVLRRFGHLGETYLINDSRNLRNRILRVLRSIDEYESALEKANSFINVFFGSTQYAGKLKSVYQKSKTKRQRVFGS